SRRLFPWPCLYLPVLFSDFPFCTPGVGSSRAKTRVGCRRPGRTPSRGRVHRVPAAPSTTICSRFVYYSVQNVVGRVGNWSSGAGRGLARRRRSSLMLLETGDFAGTGPG